MCVEPREAVGDPHPGAGAGGPDDTAAHDDDRVLRDLAGRRVEQGAALHDQVALDGRGALVRPVRPAA
ncbi:hypothetical protein, partial [Streptomyces sp. t39]|uniref:hypothetical protein n=1 Tax=Streptomyces sp. t39 TaxID=1828156 RepID=UPI00164F70E5